jgi:hypothetical protein
MSQARRPSPAPGTNTRNSPLTDSVFIHMDTSTQSVTSLIPERASNVEVTLLSLVCSTLLFLVLPHVNLGRE